MKSIVPISFIVLLCLGATAQEETKYFNKDQLGVELFSNQWPDIPGEVTLNPRSVSFNIQIMYNIIGRNSNVALATGLGVITENYYVNAFPKRIDNQLFLELIPEGLTYTTNKLRFSSVEIPLEMRIRTNRNSRNKSWKIFIGGKAGYLMNSMHKYSGDNPDAPHEHLKQKTYNIPKSLPYHYGLTFRAGYDQILISAYYSLSNRFKENKGPEMFPIMIGLSLFIY